MPRLSIGALAASVILFATLLPSAGTAAAVRTVPQSVIDAGPDLRPFIEGDSAGYSRAMIDYLNVVCPTVLMKPDMQRASLVRFCRQLHRR